MLETGILRDYSRGQYITWLYLRTHPDRRKSGEGLARVMFLAQFGRWPWVVQRLNYCTWAAGPLTEREAQ